MHWLKVYAGVVTLALLVMGLLIAKSRSSLPLVHELNAERINIVDRDGVARLVIANRERFPLPRLNGKEYPRAVAPAGMVFYDTKGDELGGLAITDADVGRIAALAFDYPNYDAIGFLTRISADGKSANAGVVINSRPPANLDVTAADKVVQRRIAIQNQDENAEILLADPQGRDRIRLRVDSAGDARIEVMDAEGRITFRAPDVTKR